jgi:hypothetical protein
MGKAMSRTLFTFTRVLACVAGVSAGAASLARADISSISPASPAPAASPAPNGSVASPDATAAGPEASCSVVNGRSLCEALYDPHQVDAEVDPVFDGAGAVGRHYVCYPGDPSQWNGMLFVHFVGTGDNPVRTHDVAELACTLGFAAIEPMYKNSRDARSVCGGESACYEGMRREVLYGGDSAPDPIRVDAANSALHRLDSMILRVAARETRFPAWTTIRDHFIARDLTNVVVSGHSQGSGHALMLARDHEVARVVMLAGPSDRLASGKPEHAAVQWMSEWAAASKTPASRLFGYNHQDDWVLVYRQVVANYDLLGMGGARCPFSEAGDYASECRRIVAAPAGCDSLDSHLTVTVHRFGSAKDACQLDGTLRTNHPTWAYLLSVGL